MIASLAVRQCTRASAYAIAGYILACSLLTLVATAMMTDYTGKDIEGEYE